MESSHNLYIAGSNPYFLLCLPDRGLLQRGIHFLPYPPGKRDLPLVGRHLVSTQSQQEVCLTVALQNRDQDGCVGAVALLHRAQLADGQFVSYPLLQLLYHGLMWSL